MKCVLFEGISSALPHFKRLYLLFIFFGRRCCCWCLRLKGFVCGKTVGNFWLYTFFYWFEYSKSLLCFYFQEFLTVREQMCVLCYISRFSQWGIRFSISKNGISKLLTFYRPMNFCFENEQKNTHRN